MSALPHKACPFARQRTGRNAAPQRPHEAHMWIGNVYMPTGDMGERLWCEGYQLPAPPPLDMVRVASEARYRYTHDGVFRRRVERGILATNLPFEGVLIIMQLASVPDDVINRG